jgi:tetratricopeptide (TPR) repeat protein
MIAAIRVPPVSLGDIRKEPTRLTFLILAVLVTLPVHRAHAVQKTPPPGFQEKTDAIRAGVKPGELKENITSAFDPTQSYAVYLPTTYNPDKTWPALFLMDPRGRARVPLDRFIPVADRLGYVLVSSYNTASDVDEDVNTPAVRAMLTDTSYMFSLDRRRFYLSGFSGTARAAWILAAPLEQFVAGIIGFGGGFPGDYRPPEKARYAFYGAAGWTDFNYEEMRALDRELDRRKIAHRVEFFDGRHQWGPPEVCRRAVEWLELQAMKSDLRAKDDAVVADIYQRRLSEPESSEDAFEAYLRYQAIVEDFAGLVDPATLDGPAAKAKELGKADEVRKTLKQQDQFTNQHGQYLEQFDRFLQRLGAEDRLWTLGAMIRELRLSDLKKQAEDPSQPRRARAAQRMLEAVYVDMAFYLPRRYLEQDEPSRAIAMLQLADYIRPGSFNTWIFFARAYAQKGDSAKAIESLEKAHEIRPLDPDLLANDRYLEPIRDEARFQEMVQRLK